MRDIWIVRKKDLLFTVAWTTSYYLLPEEVLRGKLLGQYIPIETSHVITTFLRIFGFDLLASCGFDASTLPPVTFPHLLYLYNRANLGNDDGFG
jgi:hypothetical protein